MAELAEAFLVWLICFGVVALGSLVAVHLMLRRMRAAEKASAAAGDTPAASDVKTGLSFSGRVLVTVVVGAVYLGVLGPLVGNVFAFLESSTPAPGSSSNSAPAELDALGRPVLVPVPDPISAD